MTLAGIKREANKFSSLKRKKANEWFFKTGKGQYGEGDRFIGISMPDARKVAKNNLGLSMKEVEILLHSNIHEHRMIALIIWAYQYEKSDYKTKEGIYKAYLKNIKWINNWDLVDVTAPRIIGMYMLDKPKERKVLYKLAKSSSLWERRIAILSTLAFIVEGKESKDTLKIAQMLLNDKHDLIHKAVGWMLREVGKRVSQSDEERFLKKYYKRMPRTMLRYAIERFPEGKKTFYMNK